MSISFTIEATGIDDLLAQIPDGPRRDQTLHDTLDQGRFVVQRAIMDVMPVLTGASRRNTDTTIDGLQAAIVIRGGAVFADQGVSPHSISSQNGLLLKFMLGGGANSAARLTGTARSGNEAQYTFSSYVSHPGQPAQHFVQTGLDNSLQDFKAVMESELAGMISGS